MRIARLVALPVLALALAFSAAEAEGGPKQGRPKKGAKQVQDAALVAELRQVHALITKANPTYKGHRARAMGEVRKAIHNLEREMHKKGRKPGKGDGVADESKPVSDGQLALASRQLGLVLDQLASLPATPLRNKAAAHLRVARKELQVALAVTAGKNQ